MLTCYLHNISVLSVVLVTCSCFPGKPARTLICRSFKLCYLHNFSDIVVGLVTVVVAYHCVNDEPAKTLNCGSFFDIFIPIKLSILAVAPIIVVAGCLALASQETL